MKKIHILDYSKTDRNLQFFAPSITTEEPGLRVVEYRDTSRWCSGTHLIKNNRWISIVRDVEDWNI